MRLPAEEILERLKELPDESEHLVAITDFGLIPFSDVPAVCVEVLRVLKDGGIIEVVGMDFMWAVQWYQTVGEVDKQLMDVLFDEPRCTVWDEKSLAKVLLLSGFYKVWVGRVTELPRHQILAKALKFTVDVAESGA